MIEIQIPGANNLALKHIVLDFNGTMACDGELIPGVEEKLNKLAEQLEIHIMTADTFGTCRETCRGIKGAVRILTEPVGAPEKEAFVRSLGADSVAAVGNGANDSLMLKTAALGILVLETEGAAVKALVSADIVVKNINHGLDLLLNPKRLVATLRG